MILASYSGVIQKPPMVLSIENISTYHAAKANTTLELTGSGFSDGDTIILSRTGYPSVIAYTFNTDMTGRTCMVNFDFTNTPAGEWKMEIRNSKNESFIVNDPIVIEDSNNYKLEITILGRDKIRVGRDQFLIVRVKNAGNFDIPYGYITLSIPDGKYVDFLVNNESYSHASDVSWINEVHKSRETDQKYFQFLFANLKINETIQIPVGLKANDGITSPKIKLDVEAGKLNRDGFIRITDTLSMVVKDILLNNSGTPQKVKDFVDTCSNWTGFMRNVYWNLTGFKVDPLNTKSYYSPDIMHLKNGEDDGNYSPEIIELKTDVENVMDAANLISDAQDMVELKTSPITVLSYICPSGDFCDALSILSGPLDATVYFFKNKIFPMYYEAIEALQGINSLLSQEEQPIYDGMEFEPVSSTTPEDKYGPRGYGLANNNGYISDLETFEYRIDYWNKEDATAPACEVFIRDTIDEDMDLSTLNFTGLGFLKWKVKLEGGQYFNVTVDCRPDKNMLVNIQGTIDPDTREVYWVHRALDPITKELPEDPLGGYLPAIDSTGYQIGYVTFTIKPKSDLPNGTTFSNQARVNFDGIGKWGPAPPYGPYTNVLDIIKPISHVKPLPESIDSTNILLKLTGSDIGSGIKNYIIYVSINDEEFSIWKTVADSSAVFEGEFGKKYAFFSIAFDNVGNIENMKNTAEASTMIKTSTSTPKIFTERSKSNNILIFPNPNNGEFTISIDAGKKVNSISLNDISGRIVYQEKQFKSNEITVKPGQKLKGIYIVKIDLFDEIICRKIIFE